MLIYCMVCVLMPMSCNGIYCSCATGSIQPDNIVFIRRGPGPARKGARHVSLETAPFCTIPPVSELGLRYLAPMGGTEVYLLPSTQCLCSNWALWSRDDAIPGYITPSAWAMVAVDAIMSLSLIPEDVAQPDGGYGGLSSAFYTMPVFKLGFVES